MVDKIADRGFKYHKTMGQIWTEVTRDLADSLLLPFNVSDYSSVLKDLGETFITRFDKEMRGHGLDTSLLQNAIENFTKEAEEFEKRIKTANLQDPFVVRRINDQLMQLDRAFLDPAGLPGRKLKRHILFADSTIDNYSGSSFPGLSDALVEISLGKNDDKQWKIVQKHFSVILFTIQSAAGTLKDVSDFMYNY
ncbi:N-acetylated-alpha-linked acidic dipeptidase 2-like [Mercenaria mercenaria]|uniref:N-acetylated-alpha-linked acidic dipeptidase 2-like n=1 Tax=Mercenaria mercenaria TaxID=6596 RepID=UPI00234F7A07|nr:N-acetylated-alpha-linked acidic dipeptidase 2-like [Mercenaria mercenaria]